MKNSKVKTVGLVIAVMLLGLNSGILAQRGMGNGNGNRQGKMQGYYCQNIPNLTDAQSKEITTLRTAHQKNMQTLRLAWSKKNIELQELQLADNVNTNAINKVIDEKSAISAKMQKAKVKHRNDVSNLLTDDQKVYFNSSNRGMGQGYCSAKGKGQGYGRNRGCGYGYNR